jgi:hypothetical protein
MAEVRERSPAKAWSNYDYGWTDDPVAAWRAVGLYGGVLISEGFLIWLATVGYEGALLLTLVVLILAGMFAAFRDYGEYSIALFAGAATLVGLTFYNIVVSPLTVLPSPSALFANWSANTSDVSTVLALWVAGATLLSIGTVAALRAARLDDDRE